MTDNKITRKIKRLEELENIIEILNDRISNYEKYVIECKERLEEHKKGENDWLIKNAQEDLDRHLIRMEETKKLLTEIEKMA